MSEFIAPSLDQSWQSSGLRRTFSNASTASHISNASNASNGSKILTDDDLESLSLSETPSEGDLGEDPWDETESGTHHDKEKANGLESEHESDPGILTATSDNEPRLPQHLGRDDDDDLDADDGEPSSEKGSDSTFSFNFPDPLSTSAEYAGNDGGPILDIADIPAIPDIPHTLPDIKDDSDHVGTVEEVNPPLLSETLLASQPSAIEKPTTATPITSQSRFATSSRTSLLYATGIVVSAILVGYFSRSFYYESDVGSLIRPNNLPSSVSGGWIASLMSGFKGSNVRTDAGVPLQTIQTTPKMPVPMGSGHVKTTLSNSADSSASQRQRETPITPSSPMVPVNSIAFTPSSSSVVTLTPTPLITPESDPNSNSITFSKITMALTTRLWDFSNVILHDLQDILDIITEILRFIRADLVVETVQEQSRSTIDYIMSKIGERHERAKSNARKLWKALTEFTDPDLAFHDQQASWTKTESS